MKALYQFSAADSFLHRLDPRSKLALVGCILVATFVLPEPWVMPLVPIALLWALGRIPPWEYGSFLLMMVPLIAGVTLIQTLSGGGPHIQLLGVVPLSQPGIETGLTVSVRLVAMGVAFIMFSMTTDPFDWGLAMYRAGLPYRVAFMFAFAMRFFPLLQEELGIIRNALAARGTDVFSLTHPLRFLRGLAISVIPLGVGALRRSQDIALAMDLRGFGYAEEAGITRNLYRDVTLRTRDYAVMSLAVSGLAAVIAYAWRQGGLPAPSRGQLVFAAVLAGLFLAVGIAISRAMTASHAGKADAP
jgi:energy-coupling factor transport system permease protein